MGFMPNPMSGCGPQQTMGMMQSANSDPFASIGGFGGGSGGGGFPMQQQ